jgi:hypothetical protein
MTDKVINARTVLTCDVCRREIDVQCEATLTWSAHSDGRVSALALVHKGTCGADRRLSCSDDLDRFSHPAWALRRLMNIHRCFALTAEQAQKLACVAWSASVLSTDAEKASCETRSLLMLEMGLGV